MMWASLHPPSMNAGFILKLVPSTRTGDRRNLATASAKVVSHCWNCSLDIDAVLSNQRSSITSLDGRSMISPQTSSYTALASAIAFPPRSRFLGCRLGAGRDAQTGSLFDEHLEPTGYQLTPSLRKYSRALRVDRTEGAKGKLEERSDALGHQAEACDPDAQAKVERTRELQVAIGRPLGHGGQDGAALAPSLHKQSSKARLERQPRCLWAKHWMTPPGTRILGESDEDRGIGSSDANVEGNID